MRAFVSDSLVAFSRTGPCRHYSALLANQERKAEAIHQLRVLTAIDVESLTDAPNDDHESSHALALGQFLFVSPAAWSQCPISYNDGRFVLFDTQINTE